MLGLVLPAIAPKASAERGWKHKGLNYGVCSMSIEVSELLGTYAVQHNDNIDKRLHACRHASTVQGMNCNNVQHRVFSAHRKRKPILHKVSGNDRRRLHFVVYGVTTSGEPVFFFSVFFLRCDTR